MPTFQGWSPVEEDEEAKENNSVQVTVPEPILFTKVASFDWASYDSNKIN